ncbi:MAG TPA: site-2 protease family protein [Ktedonobacteraceae bacterium]|nr:site-2 protease family protein [Ktedonobacteraceae bacterium]
MPGSLRIGSIAGINLYVHVSWLIILVLLSWSLATGWFAQLYPGWSASTYWLVSILAALLLFVSVLLHELSHSLVARARGLPVRSIILFIFGGVSNIEQEPKRPGVEFQMAFVGPLTSLVLGGIAYLLLLAVGKNTSPLAAILGYLAISNVLLGIFNLLPGFPLDGGRVLRSIVWGISKNLQMATRVATIVGQVVAYLLILLGIWIIFSGSLLSGLWLGFIGWFLLSGSQAANRQMQFETLFAGTTVGDVMNRQPVTVPSNISLHRLVYEYFLPYGWRSAFVTQLDQFVGLITLSDIRHIPQESWSQTFVGQAMVPLEKLHALSPAQPLHQVLSVMVAQGINQLPVVQDGHLIGVLNREDILRFVEIHRSLGLRLPRKASPPPEPAS